MQNILFHSDSSSINKPLFFPEISGIKGFAIISVIILHIVAYAGSSKFLVDIYASFHIWQAVPLFMLILGFTFRVECEKGYNIGKIISNRIQRILIPLTIAYSISFIILKFLGIKISLDWHTLVGLLPIRGMGNFFITLYLETIVFFSIFYIFAKKYTIYFNVTFFLLLTIIIELISQHININDSYMYSSSIHRYIPLVVMGYYFYDEVTNKSNYFLYWLSGVSTLLLFIYTFQDHQHLDLFKSIKWGFQSFPYEYYTFLFAVVLFNIFKLIKYTQFFKYLSLIGDSSLHIFIIQIFIFYIFKHLHIVMDIKFGLISLTISIFLGILWNLSESFVIKKSRKESET